MNKGKNVLTVPRRNPKPILNVKEIFYGKLPSVCVNCKAAFILDQLYEYSRKNFVHEIDDGIKAAKHVTAAVAIKFDHDPDVKEIISFVGEFRSRYISFCKFLEKPDVFYNSSRNEVLVYEGYLPEKEGPDYVVEKFFIKYGFPDLHKYKAIFARGKLTIFPGEEIESQQKLVPLMKSGLSAVGGSGSSGKGDN